MCRINGAPRKAFPIRAMKIIFRPRSTVHPTIVRIVLPIRYTHGCEEWGEWM